MADMFWILLPVGGAVIVVSFFDRTTGPIMVGCFRAMGASLVRLVEVFAGLVCLGVLLVDLMVKNWEDQIQAHERKKEMECAPLKQSP